MSIEEEKPGYVRFPYDAPGNNPDNNPPTFTLEIPEAMFWPAYETINKVGVRETIHLLNFAGILLSLLQEANVPDLQQAFEKLLGRIADPGSTGTTTTRPPMEAALDLTYTLLRKHEINWKRAASIASLILGKQVRDDAWRKRMKRWAKETGRDPIRIYNKGEEIKTDV
jgi:hypothetical protein